MSKYFDWECVESIYYIQKYECFHYINFYQSTTMEGFPYFTIFSFFSVCNFHHGDPSHLLSDLFQNIQFFSAIVNRAIELFLLTKAVDFCVLILYP